MTTSSITPDRYRAIRAEAERRIAARRAGTAVDETSARPTIRTAARPETTASVANRTLHR